MALQLFLRILRRWLDHCASLPNPSEGSLAEPSWEAALLVRMCRCLLILYDKVDQHRSELIPSVSESVIPSVAEHLEFNLLEQAREFVRKEVRVPHFSIRQPEVRCSHRLQS